VLNLRELVDIASSSQAVDYATAKRSLPIAWLLEQHGITVAVEGPRLKSNCPFHQDGEDHNQTFSVYGDDLDTFGCWSCEARGDSIDLLLHFEPELAGDDGKHTAAMYRRVRELITSVVDSGWTGPEGVTKAKPFDIHSAMELVAASQVDPDHTRIEEFIDFKRDQKGPSAWPYSSGYLEEEWNVGTYGQWLIIPYYDAEDNLFSYKRWTDPAKRRMAATGGPLNGNLYGDWREDDGERPILLCEGESDTWYGHYHVGEEYLVLGLPVGAKSSTEPAARMSGRTVYLAFDGDGDASEGTKGRGATKRWAEALDAAGADVKVVPIADNFDLSTSGDINTLLDQARPLVKAPIGIKVAPGGYQKQTKEGFTAISNWVFQPTRSLHGDGSFAFEGKIRPGGDPAVLQASDLRSDMAAKTWASNYGRTWFGNSKDAALLLGLLQSVEVFLPVGKLVSVAGLHRGTFVWPGGKIGSEPLTYVEPLTSTEIAGDLKLKPRPWSTDIVHMLRDVQRREITDPVLAFMAACPGRSRYEAFPFVAVTGAHGSGKTKTIQRMLRVFSGSNVLATFTGTPHGITSAISATNAFPIQLDEYRPGGRKDTLAAAEQLLREAYDMSYQLKGGLQPGKGWSHLTKIYPSAPIVVTGEDMLTEGSHIDRMIPLTMDERYQNTATYEALGDCVESGLPYDFLRFWNDKITDGSIPLHIDIRSFVREGLTGRQQYNLGVLHYGWQVLQAFMAEHNDSLGAPNFEGVITALIEANSHTPFEEAINYCLGEIEAREFCRLDGSEVWVQVETTYQFLCDPRRAAIFTLPGRAAAFRQYLLMRLDGREETKNLRKYVVIPYSKLSH
jgi:hypothetical protein